VNSAQARTWSDSRRDCQILGGDLASINSPQEQAFLLGNVCYAFWAKSARHRCYWTCRL